MQSNLIDCGCAHPLFLLQPLSQSLGVSVSGLGTSAVEDKHNEFPVSTAKETGQTGSGCLSSSCFDACVIVGMGVHKSVSVFPA
jgi:hypothetical protein